MPEELLEKPCNSKSSSNSIIVDVEDSFYSIEKCIEKEKKNKKDNFNPLNQSKF